MGGPRVRILASTIGGLVIVAGRIGLTSAAYADLGVTANSDSVHTTKDTPVVAQAASTVAPTTVAAALPRTGGNTSQLGPGFVALGMGAALLLLARRSSRRSQHT